MAAETHNITIEQGATFTLSLVWRDSDNALIDLTGYTARMQVRKTHRSDTVLLNFTTANGAITLGGAAGTIEVEGLATLTDDVDARTGVYDLELEDSTGFVTRLIEGSVVIKPEVTR